MKALFTFCIILISGYFSSKAQTVTTLYGNGNTGYQVSGSPASQATFTLPYQAVYNSNGSQLWITDMKDNYIVLIYNGEYYLRSGNYTGGFQDGGSIGTNGGLTSYPQGIVAGANDTLYITDYNNSAIRKLSPFISQGLSQVLGTVAGGDTKDGSLGKGGYIEGTGVNALFYHPVGIGYASDTKNGDYLVIADQGNKKIRKISLAKGSYGTTSLLSSGHSSRPEGIYIDKLNNNDIYIADRDSGIQKLSNGKISTVVHLQYLYEPTSVIVRRNSSVNTNQMYIADGCRIMMFDMSKPESNLNPLVFAGNAMDTTCDFKDDAGTGAWFNFIEGMSLSGDGNYLIVGDQNNNRIRKVSLPIVSSVEIASENYKPITIYPNPASDHIIINNEISGSAEIKLITMAGKNVINKKDVILNAGQPYNLDLENLPSGIYVLQITTHSGTSNNRIVVR